MSTVRSESEFIWPSDKSKYGLTEAGITELEEKIRGLMARRLPNSVELITKGVGSERDICYDGKRCLVDIGPADDVSWIQLYWDCIEGRIWSKRPILGELGLDVIQAVLYCKDVGLSKRGLATFMSDFSAPLYNREKAYLERRPSVHLNGATFNFSQVTVTASPNTTPLTAVVELDAVVALIDAVRKIHSIICQPAAFFMPDGSGMTCRNKFTLYHGGVGPTSVGVNFAKVDDKAQATFVLGNFMQLGVRNRLEKNWAWDPPEIYAEKWREKDPTPYFEKYGVQKDTWSLGLLIGSILRGIIEPDFCKTVPRSKDLLLPLFSFVNKRLVIDAEGNVTDDSALATLTQKEVDDELDAVIAKATTPKQIALLQLAKEYLTVDVTKRPSTADRFYRLIERNS